MKYTPEQVAAIARVCHEANRAWCEANGDTSQPDWLHAPAWQLESALNGVRMHLDGEVDDSAAHEAWMKEKISEGWVYGEAKDPEAKTHPCLVPFDDLPEFQQAKDRIFGDIVRAITRGNRVSV